jgi:nitroreductase
VTYRPRPLVFPRYPEAEMRARAAAFQAELATRRSVRHFSTEPVPFELIERAVAVAAGAPSGANQQPWTFVVVSDPELKRRIRAAAEAEERESYQARMPADWVAALEPLGTTWEKPHITDAPYLIVVFEQIYGLRDGERIKHYYARDSVGIAIGFLLCALHHAGLAALTHTPSPMRFLAQILGRPENERAVVLVPVGHPAPDAVVPELDKRPLDEVLVRL